jgi:hypothetical protein
LLRIFGYANLQNQDNTRVFTEADGPTPSIDPTLTIPNDNVFLLGYNSPTTITNFLGGYVGKVITLVAINGNTTIQSGNGVLFLSGGANFSMQGANTLTLVRVSWSPTQWVWVEIGRKI